MRRDSTLNLAWLAAFDSAARSLSFTKAAEELGLSQAAVSIQIKKLEQALGASLFERRGRHIVLTDEGYAYHPQVSEALSSLYGATSRLFTGARRGVVTISCYSPTFADHWIAPRIAHLMAEFPDLQFDLTVDYQAGGGRGERDDLIFSVASGAGGGTGLLPLVRERLTAVCAPGYLDRHGSAWTEGTFIESVGSRETWSAWRSAVGEQVAFKGREIRVNSMSAAMRLAESGAGAALVSRAFITPQLKAGTLIELRPGKVLTGRIHGLAAANLPRARPIAKFVAARLLKMAGTEPPAYLAGAAPHFD
ncbi:LysR family transcriptional regulator [Mameliella sediminis]|uniref:LysR family transcriptional regulator n=1 Tax=Mameliella sediminis TaxID=2836866 RepID=UPI001C461171|nr:LysR family transcriptional regulator [Mameliella sediminis]MBY6115283.1 LysR family transcriptional regulator [Antarctobacter heliothermus]MBY6144652.1 LysR family transcriptional regulator [Mameliella alba]MBV7395766.1 LysR family transcriptional regulator [Mameliella sediminis]MBY6160179.1 LysR family transcriptional regulator [Mameliella alba]MBY6168649.1 LysR family transcriptional regulator [Mameliella alba]